MNKDAALQALDFSKQKWKAGDKAGAIKFAEKSIRLCQTNEAEKWLSFISSSSTPEAKPQVRQRTTESTKKEEPNRPFTPEQVEGIKKIKSFKAKGDLYGILGLEKGCSDNDIKKAYRKLALKYHPDKCGAPGTDDAFKAIGHAWTVLGDEQKRSSYDRFGIDSESSGNRGSSSGFGGHPGFQGFGGHPGFQGEVTPEELLRMFMGGGAFGGSFGPNGFAFNAGPQFRTRTRQQYNSTEGSSINTLIQLLPIIILFLLTGLSIFTAEDDPFSFQRSYDYSMEKFTEPHKVPYYVNPKSYKRKFGTAARQRELNNRVESDYLHHLRVKCGQEKETQAYYIRQATSWFRTDKDLLDRAQNMAMPNCQKVNNWYNV
ncbi:hypothetical protein HDV06_000148 [Boothiomyces sp. JEL0866]|nr:hypothetical protein HDV06_000148 [Boothiomyces sp. JEL0866]